MTKLLYLASPYWHPQTYVREWRVKATKKAAAVLMEDYGYHVFAPVVHKVGICEAAERLERRHDLWIDHGVNILRRCDLLGILTLPGWERSKDIAAKRNAAEAVGIPVQFFDYEGLTAVPKYAKP